jgi:hypothetical protein
VDRQPSCSGRRGCAWRCWSGAWANGNKSVVARGVLDLAEIAEIHRSGAETPLLVVVLAERGHGGGAIGLGSNCRRSSVGR